MGNIIVADIDLDIQPVFKRNLTRCLQHGIINVYEKLLYQFQCFCHQ